MSTKLVPLALSSEIDNVGMERIHAAPYYPTIRAAWVEPPHQIAIYLGINNELNLKKSVDGAASFTATDDTGVIASSQNSVGAAGGRMYHWSFTGTPNNTFTTTDGNTFVRTTGIDGFSGSLSNVIKTSTEWQIYVGNGANYLYYSNNGVDFSMRTFTTGVVYRPIQTDSYILGICPVVGFNALGISFNEGVTFTGYTITGFKTTASGIQAIARTPSGTVLAFGRNSSDQLTIGRSLTGLSGSWTVGLGPVLTTSYVVYATVNPNTSRIIFVLSNGNTYYSDNEGVSWIQGASVPFASPPLVGTVVAKSSTLFRYYDAASAFLIATEQGSGVNRLYKSSDGVSAWQLVYTTPSNRNINGMAEF